MIGKFVVFEGIDGSGKSYIIKKIYDYLLENNFSEEDIVLTFEPTEGTFGQKVKELQKSDQDPLTNAKDCFELGCLRQEQNIPSGQRHEVCRGVHAEQNCIIQAAYHGVSTKDSTLYVDLSPSSICSKILRNAGVKKIYYENGYPDEFALDYLKKIDVTRVFRNGKVPEAELAINGISTEPFKLLDVAAALIVRPFVMKSPAASTASYPLPEKLKVPLIMLP